MSENTTTTDKSFRTAKDRDRTDKASTTVARMLAAASDAEAAVATAEAACVADPDAKGAFEKARAARKALDDANNDLSLANAHAAAVEVEIAATERATIQREIARLENERTEIVDDAAEEQAVELAVRSVALRQRTEARILQYLAEAEAINALREAIGAKLNDVPDPTSTAARAFVQMAEIGLAAQVQIGTRASDPGMGGATLVATFPYWRPTSGVTEFVTGTEFYSRVGGLADGTAVMSGSDGRPVVRRATALLERVKARRFPSEVKGGAAGVAKVAAVAGLGVLAAMKLAGG